MRLGLAILKQFLLVGMILLMVGMTPIMALTQSKPMNEGELTKAINALLSKVYKANAPGAAVIVVRDGQALTGTPLARIASTFDESTG